ncbi:[Histone H3]-lysine-36 demethylase [Saliniradius amylolyticus]|uniref:[Histone H3]-lysine-36 demethylase n=1 Tax=Saliniradius amylolyticus TaxID=2183582 RepID=A0A2S2E3U5_9ALTE|nr:cupin-like domain-containing protein [Saliniradius amylolyticus]AWL12315.1 [Histone H3]-lysine-36 demethylase [Saliniradius amylolyticus]
MNPSQSQVREWHNVTLSRFEDEIQPLNQPAVMRGLVSDWPVVEAGKKGPQEVTDFIKSLDDGSPVYTIIGSPHIAGGFSYDDGFNGVNFERRQTRLSSTLDFLLSQRNKPQSPAISVQAAAVNKVLPGFTDDHSMPLLDSHVPPTMWLGNEALVAPHFDINFNFAAVVAGRRRFTLYPPEQVANLYVGPMLNSPGGVPTSLVDIRDPDLERYPRFQKAMAASQEAVLEPGDVIYIPTPWWHGVESMDSLNILINYWWGGLSDNNVSPNTSLMHSMLSISELDTATREAWKHLFDYFVFHTSGNPKEHLPDDLRDIITRLSPEQRKQVFAYLKSRL